MFSKQNCATMAKQGKIMLQNKSAQQWIPSLSLKTDKIPALNSSINDCYNGCCYDMRIPLGYDASEFEIHMVIKYLSSSVAVTI